MENAQDKKGHKTTYTCPHTAEHIISIIIIIISNIRHIIYFPKHSTCKALSLNAVHCMRKYHTRETV